jgi:hypothetical protein
MPTSPFAVLAAIGILGLPLALGLPRRPRVIAVGQTVPD